VIILALFYNKSLLTPKGWHNLPLLVLSPTRNEILTLFISANEVVARLEGGEVFKMREDARL